MSVEKTIKAYEKAAKKYAERWFSWREPRWLAMIEYFADLLPGKKVLDAGCGPGRDSLLLAEKGLKVVGVDASKEMIKLASKLAKTRNTVFRVGDVRKLSFKGNSFDGVWCVGVLVHFPPEEFRKALKEFYRVLKKGGVLMLSVKRSRKLEKKISRRYGVVRYFYHYPSRFVRKALEENGFKILETTRDKEWVNFFAKKE